MIEYAEAVETVSCEFCGTQGAKRCAECKEQMYQLAKDL